MEKKGSQKGGDIVCNKGQIMRKGYTTKTGKIVPDSCIEAQSASGKKTSVELKRYVQKKEKMHEMARKKFSKEMPKKCPKGYILKEGYKIEPHKSHSKTGKVTNVKETWVKPTCVKSQVGKSEKGQKLITIMEKDVLAKYGYDHVKNLNKRERATALRKAISEIKPLSVYRRLIALATLNKNKDEELYKILREDADWIKTQTEYTTQKASSKKSKSKKASKKTSKKASKKSSKKASMKGGSKNKLFYYKN